MTTASTSTGPPPARYRGLKGAVLNGLLVSCVGFLIGLIGCAFIWLLTGAIAPALHLWIRLSLFGAGGGLALVAGRSICGGATDRLISKRRVNGDLGGVVGWLGGILLAGFLADKYGAVPSSAVAALAIGNVAPEIEGRDIDGQPMKLSDYRGKVAVLDFWGNW